MAVALRSPQYFSNFSNGLTDAFGLPSVQANAGDVILFTVQYRDNGANNISADPTWDGNSMTSLGARANGYMWVQTWSYIVAATATANIVCPTDSGAFFLGCSYARVYSGVTSIAAAVQQAVITPFSNPTLTSSSLASGDMIDEVLNASGWKDDFSDVLSTTWTESNSQTRVSTNGHTSVQIGNLIHSTKTGTGALTVGYAPTGGNPVYVHTLIQLVAGASTSIDTIDNPIIVGTPFNISTTGLGTLTTESTVGGIPVTAANAPGGDGALTYSFTHGQPGMLMGTVSVVASDGTNTATATGKTIQTISGGTSVVIASLDRSPTSLGSEPAINNGDEIHAPNLGGGTLAETGLFTSVPYGTYSGFWKRDATDGKMYTFTVILTSTSTTIVGLTSRSILSRPITSRIITSRSVV